MEGGVGKHKSRCQILIQKQKYFKSRRNTLDNIYLQVYIYTYYIETYHMQKYILYVYIGYM